MTLSELVGKVLALVLWSKDEHGEDAVSVLAGTVILSGTQYVIEREDEKPIELRPGWIEQIEPVQDDIKDIMQDADYMVNLPVATLPDDADMSQYIPLGLRIPQTPND